MRGACSGSNTRGNAKLRMILNRTNSATSFQAWVVQVTNVRHRDRKPKLLDLGGSPEFAERAWPAAGDDTFPSAVAHAFPQGRVGDQCANGAREIIDIVRFGDEAVFVVLDQFLWAAGIGNDDRHAGGLRFDDHIAERVSRAGKNKNVSGRVRRGQFFAPQIAGEKCLGQRFSKRLGVWAVTDDKKLYGKAFVA